MEVTHIKGLRLSSRDYFYLFGFKLSRNLSAGYWVSLKCTLYALLATHLLMSHVPVYALEQVNDEEFKLDETSVKSHEMADSLADKCPKFVWFDGKKLPFKARANGQVIIKLKDKVRFGESNDQGAYFKLPEGATSLYYNNQLNYVLAQLGDEKSAVANYESLERNDSIEWVDPHCVSDRRIKSERVVQACVEFQGQDRSLPSMLWTPLKPRSPPPVLTTQRADFIVRNALGYFEIDQSREVNPPPVVAILDNGFAVNKMSIKDTLATLRINGTETPSWNYCTEKFEVNKRDHGTKMAEIIAGDCDDEACAPGISQGARIFLSQIIDSSGDFISLRSIADAMNDASILGANIISMSFSFGETSICDASEVCGLRLIEEAIKIAKNKVLFVTGSGDQHASTLNPEYPVGFEYENVIAVQNASWENGVVITDRLGWPERLELAAPNKLKRSGNAGVSTGIAVVAGTAALMMSKQEHRNKSPKELKEILMANVSRENWSMPTHSKSNLSGGYLDLSFLHETASVDEKCRP